MGQASVNEVHLAHARVQGVNGGVDFGNHAAGNGAVFNEVQGFRARDGFDEGGRVRGVLHDAGNVGNVDKLDRLELLGKGRRRQVRVHVERLVGAQLFRQGGDDGGDLEFQRFRDAVCQAADDVAYFTDVHGVALFVLFLDAFPHEDFRAGNAYALASVVAEHLDEAGIDGSGEGAFHDGNGFRRRDAQTVDEAGLQPGFRHGLGDGLAAAVDDHGVEAQDFQQNDVAHELLDQAGVVHGAAAEFDEECLVPVGLEVGEGATICTPPLTAALA